MECEIKIKENLEKKIEEIRKVETSKQLKKYKREAINIILDNWENYNLKKYLEEVNEVSAKFYDNYEKNYLKRNYKNIIKNIKLIKCLG